MKIDFKTFLEREEIENPEDTHDIDEVIDLIKRDCAQYVVAISRAARNKLLYRGFDIGPSRQFLAVPHPKNRPAMSSSQSVVAFFDSIIDAGRQVEKIRGRSVFASSERSVAGDYGRVFYFFPRGDFEFVYSNIVRDAYDEEYDMFAYLREILLPTVDSMDGIQAIKKFFGELAAEWPDKHANDLSNEQLLPILTHHLYDSEWGVTIDNEFIRHFRRCIVKTGEHFYKYGAPEDLGYAIASRNEIMFFKTDGYYLVAEEMISKEELRQRLL